MASSTWIRTITVLALSRAVDIHMVSNHVDLVSRCEPITLLVDTRGEPPSADDLCEAEHLSPGACDELRGTLKRRPLGKRPAIAVDVSMEIDGTGYQLALGMGHSVSAVASVLCLRHGLEDCAPLRESLELESERAFLTTMPQMCRFDAVFDGMPVGFEFPAEGSYASFLMLRNKFVASLEAHGGRLPAHERNRVYKAADRARVEECLPWRTHGREVRWYMRTRMDESTWVAFVDKLEFKRVCDACSVVRARTLSVVSDIDAFDFSRHASYALKSTVGSQRTILIRNHTLAADVDGIETPGLKARTGESVLDARVQAALRSHMRSWLEPYRVPGCEREAQYDHITPPRIFIEELIGAIPDDIKVFVYRGRAKLVWVDGARFTGHTRDVYDADFERLACSLSYQTSSPQPTILEALTSDQRKSILRVAEMLAAKVDLPLVRVDLWLVDGEIYGSELTLTSEGGNAQFDFSTAGRLCDSLIFGMVT